MTEERPLSAALGSAFLHRGRALSKYRNRAPAPPPIRAVMKSTETERGVCQVCARTPAQNLALPVSL